MKMIKTNSGIADNCTLLLIRYHGTDIGNTTISNEQH